MEDFPLSLRERNESAVCGISLVCPNVYSSGLCANQLFAAFMVLRWQNAICFSRAGQGDLPDDTERQKTQ